MSRESILGHFFVEALWLPAFHLLLLPNPQITQNDRGEHLVEVGISVLAHLQNDFVQGVRKEVFDQTRQLQRRIPPSNFKIAQPPCEILRGKSTFSIDKNMAFSFLDKGFAAK